LVGAGFISTGWTVKPFDGGGDGGVVSIAAGSGRGGVLAGGGSSNFGGGTLDRVNSTGFGALTAT